MKTLCLLAVMLVVTATQMMAQNPTSCQIKFPNGGETFRPGSTQEMRWDTAGTFRARWRFKYGTSPAGPWTTLAGQTANVLDSGATRGQSVPTSGGWRVPAQGTSSGYIRMELIADSNNVFDITDNPFTIESPDVIRPDSVLRGEITGRIRLSNTKIYGIDGYLYINDGAVLEVEAGTIVVGDTVGQNSVICVNRGGKLIANGTKTQPIVFTSSAAPGQRARGDWGGIVICGKARTNHPGGQAAIEGGIAESTPGRGWFGGTDDEDNSGSLQYVRIEFAGIAVAPNNELNSLTMGGVGRGTVLNNIQVSYGNDDGFEWFGGTVNAKNLISYGILDDDFDTDNGFRGKVQFVLVKRFRTTADVSTSQAFESDNDATGSFNAPLTNALFSNVTVIGPVQDTSWTTGSGANQFSSRYGAAAQIRRNSRQSIFNSVFIGWPRGIEIAQVPTMAAANTDSLAIRTSNWYGIKGTWLNLAGGTPPAGMDANWISKAAFNNSADKTSPNNAFLSNPWPNDASFNPAPLIVAPYLNTASYSNGGPLYPIDDAFFTKVNYRGAFAADEERWDEGWANYDPVNSEYRAAIVVRLTKPGVGSGESYLQGTKIAVEWDTTSPAGNTYKFEFGTSAAGPWSPITGAESVVDAGASRGKLANGFTAPNIVTSTGYVKMTLVSDPSKFDISDAPFAITAPVVVEPTVRLIEPGTNVTSVRVGQSVTVSWDTTGTYRQRWRFDFGKTQTGPWTTLPGLSNVLDSAARRGQVAGGIVFRPADQTETGYVRMVLLSDTTKTDVNNTPIKIIAPAPVTVDSVLRGEITSRVHLSNTKIYGLDGYVYVNDGAVLEIEPGTIILGDTVGQNSVLCINKGGKIIANGTRKLPIVFTSSALPGQRARGDWGGIVICGKARTNHPGGQAAIEGGIAETTTGGRGWFGGTDDDDSSGSLQFVRIEFAGIAVAPNNELNSLTMGGVGSKTILDHIQVSHGNDDGFEWFGGTVNAKHLISVGILDDDFDTDNGYRGKVQYGIVQRFRTVADVSTSQAFESDNDANASFNQPLTTAVFSNITAIGPLQDTSWTTGSGANQYSSRFGAAAQIRRNSRQSIHNSLFLGWPRGFEIAQLPTMVAANGDSLEIRNNSWYGVKGATMTLAGLSGSQTPPAGFDNTWLLKPAYNNIVDKSSPSVAMVEAPFITNIDFNPALKSGSPALSGAAFAGTASDPFFENVAFRGAVGIERWDLEWTEYDPVNRAYKAQDPSTSVNEEMFATLAIAGRVFPNPTQDASTVRYELAHDDVVTVRVTDATGALSTQFLVNAPQTAGTYEFRLITADLASGIYYLTITGQRGTITLPVTVAH
ncbi:MAG: T9SS type A sorting domain-containing protein [Ignavibacteria bacterium]|nr:T9SS type A sorting domain-containing protein [Ignavibacteria bacterium]